MTAEKKYLRARKIVFTVRDHYLHFLYTNLGSVKTMVLEIHLSGWFGYFFHPLVTNFPRSL